MVCPESVFIELKPRRANSAETLLGHFVACSRATPGPLDTSNWTAANGSKAELGQYPTVEAPRGWQAAVTHSTDPEGWQYASAFKCAWLLVQAPSLTDSASLNEKWHLVQASAR